MALAGVRLIGLVTSAALILALGAGPPTYRAQSGFAVMYSKNVMEAVARNRGIAPQACMIAWTAARDVDIGRTWLHIEGPAGTLDCLTVDLPQDVDRPALEQRGVLVELGYPSRWICGKNWSGRARDCRVRVWVIPDRSV